MYRKKYSTNQNVMDKIDTQEKAYWLGFFYADAYNKEKTGQIIIELQERDKPHLYKCAKFFDKPREPFKQFKNKGKYVAYRLELNGRHLSNNLKEKGCYGAKSFNITFPNWMGSKLIRHFIRGYFDGDGSLYIHQNQLMIEIVSTKEMNDVISLNITDTLGIKPQIRTKKKYSGNTTILYFGGSRQVKRFLDWIYKDATIYLDRKYDSYKSYCENHEFRFSD